METLKQKIEALPEPERSARRAFYSDDEWENSWELNAFPFQLPPRGDWDSWTVIGGRGVGKTRAGMEWAVGRFLEGNSVVSVFHHDVLLKETIETVWKRILASPNGRNHTVRFERVSGHGAIDDNLLGTRMLFTVERNADSRGGLWGIRYDYVWSDETTDASEVRHRLPSAKRYVFTGPVKLDPNTIFSRAGDERV